MTGANAGRAVFEAVGRFGPLVAEGKRAETQLKQTRAAGESVGTAIPRDGGQTARGLTTIGEKADRIGRKVQNTGRSISLGIGAPTALLGGIAIKSFAQFEKSLVAAQLKAGASEKQYERMKDLALEMGAATSFSAGEAAGALDSLAALGFDAEKAIAALPGVLKAAQASGEELGLTTETVAKAMNAFNIEGKDAEKVADVFAQAANTTALSMQDIAYGMANAGEVGPRFGQDMTGVIAVLGRLVDMGVPAASAGVAIRSALVALATPTDKAKKKIEALGIEVRDAEGNMKQLPDIMRELEDALSASNPKMVEAAKAAGQTIPEYRDATLKAIGMVEGAKAISLAISDGKPIMLDAQKDQEKLAQLQEGLAEVMGGKAAEAWIKQRTEAGKFVAKGADAVKAIDAMGRASEGTSEKFSDAFQKTTAQKIDNLIGSLETLGITLIETVAPALTDIITIITDVTNAIGDFADRHDWAGPLIAGAALFLVALGPVLWMVGTIARGVGALAKGGGALARLVKGRRTTGPPAGGTSAGDALGGTVSVFWTKPMPVYITNAPAAAGGGKGGTPAKGGTTGYSVQGGRTHAEWKKENQAAARAQRQERRKNAVRGVKRGAMGAGAAAGTGAALALMSGGGAGEVAKMAGIFAAVELAITLVGKALILLGPKILLVLKWLGSMALTALKATGSMIVSAVRVGAAWTVMAAKAMLAAGRMALAWTIGVIKGASKAIARMAVAAAFMIARWTMMAVQALLQAARMAAAWLIAMGPVGLIIAIVIALAILIYKNWDKIKKYTEIAWKWVWDKIKWFAQKILDLFLKWTLVGQIIQHWDEIRAAIGAAVDWILEKIQPLLDGIGKIADGLGAVGDAAGGIVGGIGDAAGGLLGKKRGGVVPGRGRGDIVPARLEPGEFVVRRSVAQGPGMMTFLRRLNAVGPKAADSMPNDGLARKMAANAMRGAITGSGGLTSVSPGAPPKPPPIDPPGGGRPPAAGGVTVNVYNPKPERASQSVRSALRDETFEGGAST